MDPSAVRIVALGGGVGLFSLSGRAWKSQAVVAVEGLRKNLGRDILLGLEILIVADIILTITVEPTLESALSLGVVVLVRTFLSFSLEIELEGVLPWRRERPNGETQLRSSLSKGPAGIGP